MPIGDCPREHEGKTLGDIIEGTFWEGSTIPMDLFQGGPVFEGLWFFARHEKNTGAT